MSVRNQPDRIAKKRTYEMMMAKSKPRKFDLLTNYGEPDITENAEENSTFWKEV